MLRICRSIESVKLIRIGCICAFSNGNSQKSSQQEMDREFEEFLRKKEEEKKHFFYSHRKSGKSYTSICSDLSSTDRKEWWGKRLYVWPPIKDLYPPLILLCILCVISFVYVTVYHEGSSDRFFSNPFRTEAGSRMIDRDDDESARKKKTWIQTENTQLDKSPQSKTGEEKTTKSQRRRIGFRERRIIEYENRIRLYSTPDKIFRYFATLKLYPEGESPHGHNFDIFMTPEDFVRSITPNVMQPHGLGLDQYRIFDSKHHDIDKSLHNKSIFFSLGEDGLISFSDYLFLLTVLSTSPRHFALVFRIFDINGDGCLDIDEFEQVQQLVMMQTTIGQKHRDHTSTGSCLKHGVNSALASYFFGKEKEGKLTIDTFLSFQERLQRDILRVEFDRRDPLSDPNRMDRISEWAFTDMLLMHSGLAEKKQLKMKKRVRKYYKNLDNRQGICFAQVENFFKFLAHINDVDMALTFYRMAGVSVDAETLQHVAKTVAGVEISSDVIDLIFRIFDENQDGQLSHSEFIGVMKRRLMRGLERPKDTGFIRMLSAFWACSWEKTPLHT